MNLPSIILGGLVATTVMTLLMSASQLAGLSRMSLPYMLGTMFTPNRDRALPIGAAVHLVNGWAFALLYGAFFEFWSRADWWMGALMGLVHGLVIFVVLMPVMPGLHPRMANERQGPEPTRALEPPGPLALNYGRRTPLIGLSVHVLYGFLIALFYPTVP